MEKSDSARATLVPNETTLAATVYFQVVPQRILDAVDKMIAETYDDSARNALMDVRALLNEKAPTDPA